ncbi:MAG TPA: PHP domain-containing protein [Vicinamibacterales bacterium]|jgi:histidinol phosphatase-like PHP family hydrolase|nr:PHP domain-containing protein [Vicinamibacterales bacterium]
MRDVNLELASLLYDMSAVAGDSQRAWGYKRAAKAVLRIDRDITPLVTANTFKSISGIGPTTDRIARELILEGRCAFVERAVREAGKDEEIARLHNLRRHYLSRAAVKQVLARKGSPSRAKYRGDFQMHSIYSDGGETLESIVNACLERGWSCAGITDHSYGLSIAGGMSMQRAVEQHAEVDALNRKYGGRFRLFKGIEANIRADGSIDMEPHEMRQFEFIVASPHSALRKSVDQTARMVAAVSQRGVAILGHPQGRVFNMRLGVLADWSQVFEVAARRQVAIEIDGSWSRQDVPYELAAQALEQGCLFALDSDAHSHPEFDFADIAIAHAKLAGIPQAKIVNYWPEKKFLDWAAGAWDR